MSDRNNVKAAVYRRYGSPDILKVTEIQRPVPTKDGEVLFYLCT
jgi:hypothetical protein